MATEQEVNPGSTATGRTVEAFNLVSRHLMLIIFTSLVGLCLGYLNYVRTPPVYLSTGNLHIRNESKQQSIPFQGAENGTQGQRDQPHAQLISSPLIVERALEIPLGDASSVRRMRDLPCFAHLDNPATSIISRLSVRQLQGSAEQSEIVTLSYRNSDPLACKVVLDAIIESYKEFLADNHRNVSLEVLKLIEEAKVSLLKQLRDIEADYAQFREDTPLLFFGDDKATNFHRERMAEIELARRNLLILITDKKAQLQSIHDALSHGGNREAISLMLLAMKPDTRSAEAGIKSPASEIFQLQLEEQLLLQDLGPDHPKVKTIQKKIAMTQDFLLSQSTADDSPAPVRRGDFLTVCLESLKYEIQTIESRRLELDELFEAERYESKSIATYEMKNSQYQKDFERTDALYQRTIKRLDELNLVQDYGGYKTAVISPPRVGVQIAPLFDQCLLLGGIFGAVAGLALAYLAEANDKTFRSPNEVSEQLGLPIVGHIPVMPLLTKQANRGSAVNPVVVTFFKPKSRAAEAFRAIRTSLYFSTRGEKHKVLQITSPNPGDGKTTLSVNLAVSIAQSGKKILIIDADFRRPKIHSVLGLTNEVGMSSVISGQTELPDAIQATEVENLWCLTCGPRPNNPCELLTSRRFEELLEVLREQYDFVIVDTPPVLAVTDPGAVAPRVDGVILAISLSKRTRAEATKSIEQLTSLGANILGIVVNRVGKAGGAGYGNYPGYGEYSSYQSRYTTKYNYGYDYGSPYYVEENAKHE